MQQSFYQKRLPFPFGYFLSGCSRKTWDKLLGQTRDWQGSPPGKRNQDTGSVVEIQSHLVTLQKGKLKADVSYITDHIQSPKAYLIRSKHEVTTCYSGMKKCTGRKEEEEKFLITDYFITYLEKSAFWYKFVLFMMVLIRQYNLFFFSLGPFPLCKKMEEGGIQKEDDVE